MEKESNKGCGSIIAVIVCLIISALTLGFLAEPLGFLAYPIIIGGGLGLAKLTEPIWSKEDNNNES